MLSRSAWLLLCLLLCLSACAEHVESDQQRLEADTKALADVGRLRELLAAPDALSAGDFSTLQDLHARFPAVNEISTTYKAALIRRADWGALETFLRTQPAQALTVNDRRNLIAACFKQGKFAEVVTLATPLAAAGAADAAIFSMLGESYFNLGQSELAAQLIDARWQAILSTRSADEIALRGRIYAQQGDVRGAVTALEHALEIDPAHTTALYALARLYYGQGDRAQAEALRRRSASAQAQTSAQEQRALRSVYLTRTLSERWQQQRYDEVVALADEALTLIAEPKVRAVLYEYIVESQRRLGRADLANGALEQQKGEAP